MGTQLMVQNTFMKRFWVGLIATLHLLSLSFICGSAHAQSAASSDSEAPMIDLQVVESGDAADSQVFSATVTDDVSVAEVVLYYRLEGDEQYARAPMEQIPSTNFYSVTIASLGDVESVIEYYINAADQAGNRVLRGFAFDPLRRVLESSTPAATQANNSAATAGAESAPVATAPSSGGMSTGRKILYGVLGVLVVGAVAAAATNSDSPPSMPMPEPEDPVIVTILPGNPVQ